MGWLFARSWLVWVLGMAGVLVTMVLSASSISISVRLVSSASVCGLGVLEISPSRYCCCSLRKKLSFFAHSSEQRFFVS